MTMNEKKISIFYYLLELYTPLLKCFLDKISCENSSIVPPMHYMNSEGAAAPHLKCQLCSNFH